MECERLQRLVKAWYAQVQDESMAPARMVSFMEKHIAECAYCLADPLVRRDIEKITAIILPPTKIRKPVEDEEEDSLVAESDDLAADEDVDAGTEDEDTDDDGEALEDEELGDDELEDDDE